MQRKAALDSIILQERDIVFLRGLFDSRVMTAAHVTALYFDGRAEAAKKRTQKLKAAGLVAERRRKRFEPAVLFLAEAALRELKSRGLLAGYPPRSIAWFAKRARVSPRTITHELAVVDVKVAVSTAVGKAGHLSLVEFTTWPLLCEFRVHNETQKPDGFVRIHEKTPERVLDQRFFLEVDLSTEPQQTLERKAVRYREYHRTGIFARRQGHSQARVEGYPFRVLFVFETEERQENFAARLLALNPPVLAQAWLTTRANVLADPLGPIWRRPRDYRHAMYSASGGSPVTVPKKPLFDGPSQDLMMNRWSQN